VTRILGPCILALLLAACSGGGGPAPVPPVPAPATVFYSIDIQPIFDGSCITCHGSAGGLSTDTYADLIAGGQSGAVVIAGDPVNSILIRRLEGSITPQMPLNIAPLTQPEIDRIATWIAEGARDN